MDSGKRINLADAIEGKGYDGPEFIRLTPGPYNADTCIAIPALLTVAQWREAQKAAVDDDAAVDGDDEHSLRQFRMATLVLAMAEQNGLPEDAVAMPTLGFPQAVEDVAVRPDYLQGADGIWRQRVQ